MMNPSHIQAVVQPAIHVVGALTGVAASLGRVQMVTSFSMVQGYCAVINFEGEAEGSVLLLLDRAVGQSVASKMSGEILGEREEEEVGAALMELLNMVAGHSVGLMAKVGLRLSISPPFLCGEVPNPPYGANCAMIFLNSQLGILKFGLMLAVKDG